MFKYSSLNPCMGATIRSLSNLAPHTLALMHGPSFTPMAPPVPYGIGSVNGERVATIALGAR
jgi:hypothetical protein